MRKKSGQTSMILIVLIIIIFMSIGIFLLISSIKPEYDEYYNLYAHNLLLSVLRRNTGYGGHCDTISSTVSCAHITSYRECDGVTCRNLSGEIVPDLIRRVIKPTFDYCMIIEPENWTVMGGDRIVYGSRCDVVMSKGQRWTANEKILQYEANLNIKMIIAET
ncbi:MAG: hypothetical protein JSV39_02585 [Candidatus Aenigmatarchaeota archaeon]|nr:MAG: hypothetical protein JSV39_02585 [Candidatus Aenigmarchaeota archaeon]